MAMNVNRINQNNNYNIGKPKVDAQFSALKMRRSHMGSGDMGLLIPGHVHEMLPGQKITVNNQVGLQFNPFITNLFHELEGEIMCWFTPNRLTWQEWEKFIIGGVDGEDSTEHPTMSLKDLKTDADDNDLTHTLADYFGMPINFDHTSADATEVVKPTALLWYGYNQGYNDIIRMLDFEEEADEIALDNNEVLRGNWDHDYFTRSRIYQQRGVVPSVPISEEMISLEHEITGSQNYTASTDVGTDLDTNTKNVYWESTYSDKTVKAPNSTVTSNFRNYLNAGSISEPTITDHDLSTIGTNLNDFLISLGIMKVQINNAKVQPRYVDQLEIRFGIYPQDARLNRAEYLGSQYFNVSTDIVQQTSYGDAGSGQTEQGNITGQAWGKGGGPISYEAKEHGYLYCVFIVRPKPVYEGGLRRNWVKNNRWDYATPELANLPDRKVYQYELMYTDQEDKDKTEFGWQGMYEEYRTLFNEVTGKLRPSNTGELESYTLARYWEDGVSDDPTLNKAFVGCEPDQDRILQYTDEPCFVFFFQSDINTALPLPLQSQPGDLKFL